MVLPAAMAARRESVLQAGDGCGYDARAMSLIDTVRRAVRYIAREVGAEARALFDPVFTIRILQDDGRVLVLDHRGSELRLDRRFGTVKSGSRVRARFSDIRAVVVRRTRMGGSHLRDEMPEIWTVSLQLGWFSRVHVGRTNDDAEASIVAARIASLTGKPVATR